MKLIALAPFPRTFIVYLLPLLLATTVSASLQTLPAAGRNSRQGLVQEGKKVKPKLDPKSDRVFFGHDYPDDLEPHAKKTEFSHPYPAVQDTDEYDRDYVKDENNDNGEWKAQMDYDLLRTRVARQKDDLEKAKATEKEMQKKLDAAKKREATATKAAEQATERARKAKDHADGLKKEAKDKEEQAVKESKKVKNVKKAKDKEEEEEDLFKEEEQEQEVGKPTKKVPDDNNDDIDKAVANVKKEMSELKGCEKELVAARKELKEAMAKADNAAQEKAAKDAAAHEQWMKERDDAARRADSMAARAAKYRSDHARRVAEEDATKEALEKKEAEYAAAQKDFNEADETLQKTEGDMKKAAENLRNFRRVEDIGGGVSWRPHKDPKTGRPVTPAEQARIEKEEAHARHSGRTVKSSAMPTCAALLLPALLALFSTA